MEGGAEAGAFLAGAGPPSALRGCWVKRGWAQRPRVLYSPAPCILPSPCQDFRVGLQSPSSEAREAKGSNVPGSQ